MYQCILCSVLCIGGVEQKIKISLNNLGASEFPLNKKHQGKYLTNLVFNLSPSFYFSIEPGQTAIFISQANQRSIL